ncbi:MAG: hypothetical protein ACREOH_03175 [Candidatus Entotheonellia bacterium]
MVCGIIPQSGGSIGADSAPGRGTPGAISLPQVEEVREQQGRALNAGINM